MNQVLKVLVASGWLGFVAASVEARPPNVVLILTDDQGWGDIHAHGNEVIDTPHLDRLRIEGARFDRFFVSPVCAPTRSALLTGRYHPRTGVHGVTRGAEDMRAEETTLAEGLKQYGYATGCFGKWHNGAHYPRDPNGQGFDEFLGFCAGHWLEYVDPPLQHNQGMERRKGYITDILTDAAMDFMEARKDGPFFCYIPFNAPHSPWIAPEPLWEKYKAMGLPTDEEACAYAMVENIDQNVGRLLEKLDALKLSEDTIVIFCTDNGPNSDRYNGGMLGRKGSVQEGGVRVPFFVSWRGKIAPGLEIHDIAAHIDVMPTVLELCGISHDPEPGFELDGLSFARALRGARFAMPRRHLFVHQAGKDGVTLTNGSVRSQKYRASLERAKNGSKDGWRLFDLESDPGQKENIAERYPDLLAEMRGAYEAWFDKVTRKGFDPLPVPVGMKGADCVLLQAHQSILVTPTPGEGLQFANQNGYAHDWAAEWTDLNAYVMWPVEVNRGGRYEVWIEHAAREETEGSELQIRVGDARLGSGPLPVHDPEPLPKLDQVPRHHITVPEIRWEERKLGEIRLEPGKAELQVRLTRKVGAEGPWLKSIRLQRLGGD